MPERSGYVGFWRRALAATIDNAVWLIGLTWLFGDALGAIYDESPEAAGLLVFVFLSAWFNYFALSEWRWGQTIGKNAVGIEVVSAEGEPPRFGQASLRNLLRLVDLWAIGPIMIAAGERRQRLGDLAAGTLVVYRKPRALAVQPASGGGPGEPPGSPGAPDPPPPAPPPPAPEFRDSPYVPKGARFSPPPPPPSGPRGALPAITWSLKNTIYGLVAGLVAGIFIPLLVLPFDPDLDSEAGLLVAQALFGVTLIAVAVGVAARWSTESVRDALGRLGLRRFAPSALGWMLVVMFTYYVGAALFAAFVVQPEQEDIGGELGACGSSLAQIAIPVALIAGLAPISEELFFRGFLFSGLRSRLALWPAAVIAGLIFGLVHAPTGVTTVIPLAGLGVGLCWLYERTGSLWPPILAHAINNSIALALLCNTG